MEKDKRLILGYYEIMPFRAIGMDLEIVILNEARQRSRNIV